MADTKITGLAALTGANLATGDLFEMVDVSDTTMDTTGTNKKMTASELAIGIATVKPPSRSISDTHTDSSAVNTTSETVVASQAIPTTVAAGDVLRLVAVGDMLNNSGSTVNYTFKGIVGATAALTTPAVAVATNAARHQWKVVIEVLVASTSDERVSGNIWISTPSASNWATGTATLTGQSGRGTATEDLTAGKNLQLSVTLGTAVSTADFVCHESWLEVVKRLT